MNWREMLGDLFAALPVRKGGTLPDLARFDLGVCPGCKGLRLATSPRCTHCGSAAAVTADA